MIAARGIDEALALLPRQMDTPAARVQLVATALQESGYEHRFQIVQGRPGVKGPARGYWQFERGGACAGVLRHNASRYWMHMVCRIRGCAPTPLALWHAIETDDVLAAAAARLLIFTDPYLLPAVGDKKAAWALYLRLWRPGKPKPKTWPENHARAIDHVVLHGQIQASYEHI